MNWEAIGALGEVIGALAVFLTLIYLAVQVRQHTRAMEETRKVELSRNAQFRTEQRITLQKTVIENEHLRNAMAKMRRVDWPESKEALKELNHHEHESFVAFLRMQVLVIENIWFQGQQSLIDDELYENTVPAIIKFGNIWEEVSAMDTVRPDFREEVSRLTSKVSA